MKFIILLFLLIAIIYPFNYARYNWTNKNKFGAVGMYLLIFSAIVFPALLMIFS